MKFGAMEVKVLPIAAGTATPAAVSIALRACGMQLGAERITPEQARQLAGALVAAADIAQVRAG